MHGANMKIPFEQLFLKFYDREFYEKFSPLSTAGWNPTKTTENFR